MKEEIIKGISLKKYFLSRKKTVKALDGVDIFVHQGKTTGLVGESGCGKTTLARVLMGFYTLNSGKIFFEDRDISNIRRSLPVIRENFQMVFQNPYLSFDPRYSMFSALYEVLRTFSKISKKDSRYIIEDILNKVGLKEDAMSRYPHQLSGGQLQRVSIARALIKNPHVVILDEPTSNLDVSTTVKIMSLLYKLRDEKSLSYLFISHNLKLVSMIADYIFVMYSGKIVEYGPKNILYQNPVHPYTKLLIEASEYKLRDAPFKTRYGEGCVFRGRCANEGPLCKIEPGKKEIEPGHFVFCHYV